MLTEKVMIGLIIFSSIFISSSSYSEDCQRAKEYVDRAKKLGNDHIDLKVKETYYKEAIKLCPSLAEAQNNLGDVYEKQGKWEDAIHQYKKTVDLEPNYPYSYFSLGDIYSKMNKFQEAGEWYRKGLQYAPADAETNMKLAMIHDRIKRGILKAETMEGILSVTRSSSSKVISIIFGEDLIPFNVDTHDVKPAAIWQLNEIGRALRKILMDKDGNSGGEGEKYGIEIAGHTDLRGTEESSLELSRKRAEAVKDYLIKNFKIPREKLRARGYGQEKPICASKDTEECLFLNRRIEIVRVLSAE